MAQICQRRLSILPKRNKTPQICQILVSFCKSGEILPNLVTLTLSEKGREREIVTFVVNLNQFQVKFSSRYFSILRQVGSSFRGNFFRRASIVNYNQGQWLWLSWQSGRFLYQRSVVRIQSSAKIFHTEHIYC